MFAFFLGIIFTLIMLVPFGFLAMYAIIALRLLAVSYREGNDNKKRSAQKTLLLSVSGMLLLIFVWILVMVTM